MERPELLIAALATGGLVIFALVRFVAGILEAPRKPDPWDSTITAAVNEPDAHRVCHRCLTPHDPVLHFCPACGTAVGEFNNLLPWEQCFSEGEVLRNGTTLHMRPTPLIVIGYLLLSGVYYFFAPVYWYFLFRNLFRRNATPDSGAAQ